MFRLSLGYFLAYLPYAMLVKAMSSGVLPGVPPVGAGRPGAAKHREAAWPA